MSSKVSTLTVSLKDDVSGKAGQIGRALKSASDQARAMAKALDGSGASRGFVNNLSKLGLSAKDIERVSASLKDYTKAAGMAGAASTWTKSQTAQVRAWESSTIASLRHVAAEQKALASSTRDMMAGMSRAGRDMIDRSRIAAGMSAPARAAMAQKIKAEAELRERLEAQAASRSDARRAIAGMAGVYVGHKVKEGTHSTLETYREFDKYSRATKAFGNFSDDEMSQIVAMAIHKSAGTKFNDIQWLEGAKALGGRGVKAPSVMSILPEASNYGQAMDTTLPEAVAGLEGSLFAFQRDLSTAEKARAAARRTSDIQVAAAKSFGLTHDDLKGGYQYGALAASSAGISEEKLLAFMGLGKKLNIAGDAQGNAFNTMVAKILSPDQKGREALAAMGVNVGKFQTLPKALSVDNFSNLIAQQYGVRLNDGGRAKLGQAFADPSKLNDPAAFAVAVREAVQGQVGVKGAQDAKKVAGAAERFRRNNVQKTDADGLFGEIMDQVQGGNLAIANAIFGPKQARRIMAAMRDKKLWDDALGKVEGTKDGKAEGVAKERMAGIDGATSRFENAVKNLETAMGRSFDNDGKGGFLTGLADKAARATQALADLPKPALQVGGALAWLGGKAASAAGTAALVGAAFALNGSAGALTAAAGRLGLAGAAGGGLGALKAGAGLAGLAVTTLTVGSIAVAGAITAALLIDGAESGKAKVHGGTPDFGMNPGDELPGLDGSTDKPSWTRTNPRAIPSMLGHGLPQSPGGPGSGLSGFGLSGPQGGVAPRGDDSGLKQVHASATELKAVLDQLNGVSVTPQANSGPIDTLIGKAQTLLNLLRQIPGAASLGNVSVEGIKARASPGGSGAYQGPEYGGP